MQKKNFSDMQCPIARSLERVGEWWSILVLREAFYGSKRFDEFQKNLDIATNMLSRRLSGLVEQGLLERRQYCEKPPRYEYVLTPRGRDFRPVLLTLLDWGNKHFATEGIGAELVERASGKPVDLVLVDAHTGRRISPAEHAVMPGPQASEGMRRRLLYNAERAAGGTPGDLLAAPGEFATAPAAPTVTAKAAAAKPARVKRTAVKPARTL
jgi:DNA-binding HxlR family transcriptional regulator